METSSTPHPDIDLSPHLYYQLVHTLTDLLPPPLDDTPEALYTRNHAAIAKVAALLPVNANEADLAAQCIAARAQAEDILRLLRQHAHDIGLVMRLNAQYGSMVRTSHQPEPVVSKQPPSPVTPNGKPGAPKFSR